MPQSTISATERERLHLGVERTKLLVSALKCHPAVLAFPGWGASAESASSQARVASGVSPPQADALQVLRGFMISIEKEKQAEEIFFHGSPEDLRDFAKRLWAIAEHCETKGKHNEHITTKSDSKPQLSSQLVGEIGKHSVIKKLTICSRP